MVKEWIICTIVVFIVIITNVVTEGYTDNSVDIINGKLENLKNDLTKEDINKEDMESQVDQILKEWREKYEKLAYYIEHNELEKVETELSSLKANVEIEKYDEGVIEIERSVFILNHIREKFKFKVRNIF